MPGWVAALKPLSIKPAGFLQSQPKVKLKQPPMSRMGKPAQNGTKETQGNGKSIKILLTPAKAGLASNGYD